MADKNKKDALNYRKGILLSVLSGLSSLLILYVYSRNTSPENEVFINHSLYMFAVMVLSAFFVCVSFIIIGIKKALFSKKYQESNPSKLIYYVQSSFKKKTIKYYLLSQLQFIFFFSGFFPTSSFFLIMTAQFFLFSIHKVNNRIIQAPLYIITNTMLTIRMI